MKQITNIQELKTAIDENGEMVITSSNNNILVMKIEEYMEKRKKLELEKHLLRAEDDIEKGRVRDAREVFKEWKEQYNKELMHNIIEKLKKAEEEIERGEGINSDEAFKKWQ